MLLNLGSGTKSYSLVAFLGAWSTWVLLWELSSCFCKRILTTLGGTRLGLQPSQSTVPLGTTFPVNCALGHV